MGVVAGCVTVDFLPPGTPGQGKVWKSAPLQRPSSTLSAHHLVELPPD